MALALDCEANDKSFYAHCNNRRVICVMGDEDTKSSGTMWIPRLCGRTNEGPVYRRLNVRCPSSEANRKRAQPTHTDQLIEPAPEREQAPTSTSRRSMRQRRPPLRFRDYNNCAICNFTLSKEERCCTM